MQENPVNVAVIGCGMISQIYLANLTGFKGVRVVACADMIQERAEQRAKEFGVERAATVEEVLRDPSIELIVNLTVPKAHAEVTLKAIESGKSAYSEKPLAISREEGKRILEAAKAKNVRVGCAPDTFLGGGFQTARKLLDDGWIGKPVGAVAVRADHGPDEHPNAAFFYQKGGGPLFDMGPYYLTELVNLLGPIKKVTGMNQISFAERPELSRPPYGKSVKVEVPTYITGILDFHAGVLCTLITSFDVWAQNLPHIEIYGTSGSIQVPNPNRFGGTVKVKRFESEEWINFPSIAGYTNDMMDYRGIGVLDLAYAIRSGREHRANLEMAYHVLDTMVSLYESANSERHVYLQSSCRRPAPLPLDPTEGEINPLNSVKD